MSHRFAHAGAQEDAMSPEACLDLPRLGEMLVYKVQTGGHVRVGTRGARRGSSRSGSQIASGDERTLPVDASSRIRKDDPPIT